MLRSRGAMRPAHAVSCGSTRRLHSGNVGAGRNTDRLVHQSGRDTRVLLCLRFTNVSTRRHFDTGRSAYLRLVDDGKGRGTRRRASIL